MRHCLISADQTYCNGDNGWSCGLHEALLISGGKYKKEEDKECCFFRLLTRLPKKNLLSTQVPLFKSLVGLVLQIASYSKSQYVDVVILMVLIK